ncbi:ImpA family type VI secretion system protein [Pseudochrobactrum sp. HB0163]|uniref:type VI secretion system protein TssA n=1 Tax=Pseudochrobactrum sp. HB0163 TaxID=3450708 RepID=UPI003F6DCEBA
MPAINPRDSSTMRETYYATKDLRMSVRQREKYGEISPTILEEWKIINRHLTDLFSAGCADLELCSWLAEASLRLEGFTGLERAFQFISGLISAYGHDLTSIEPLTEMPQFWIAPIAELSGEGSEGVLIQPLRLCPLIPESRYGSHNLWHYQSNVRMQDSEIFRALDLAVSNAGQSAMHLQRETIHKCIMAYKDMLAHLDKMLPEHPCARTNLVTVLQECVSAINDLCGFDKTGASLDTPPGDISLATGSVPAVSAPAPLPGAAITSRDQALKLLGDVASFFRRQEPQSPIAPALETLIRRGHLPFDALLEELLPDENIRCTILTSAGIRITGNHDH